MTPDWRKLLSGTDIRGDEALLTDEFAQRFGYAYALWLANRLSTTPDQLAISVGRDPRASGPRIEAALIRGITAADADVIACALTSAPALSLTLHAGARPADGSVMVTAGNCAPGVNGLKLMTRAGGVSAEDVRRVIESAMALRVPERLVASADPVVPYMEALAATARTYLEDDAPKPLLGLHIVVDASGGAGGFYARFLEELGAETTGSLNLLPDGRFPAHAPDAADPSALAALSRAVIENTADLGVLFDGDCTCAAIVDDAGRAIIGNRLIALISAVLLDKRQGATVVTDSVTSSGLTRFISEWGGVHYRYKRGYLNVIEEARRLNEEGIDCPLAIETSGHAAFRENHFIDDGMYLATRLICEAYDRKRFDEKLSDLLDCLQEPVESRELRLRISLPHPADAARDVIEMILSHTVDNPRWRLATDSREGVRILFNLDGGVENAWFQLRMSVHDPHTMVLNAQSDVYGGIRRMMGELLRLLEGECMLDLTAVAAIAD